MSNDTIRIKANTHAFWTTQNPLLKDRELLLARTGSTRDLFVGDGVTRYTGLTPISLGGAGASAFAALTDRTTVDIVALNGPLQTALAARDAAIAAKVQNAMTASTTVAPSATAAAAAIATAQAAAVAQAKSDLLNGAGPAFDTLVELAAALGNDPSFATTVAASLAGKLSNSAGAVGSTNLAAGAVGSTQMASIGTKQYLGRTSAGTGVVENVAAAVVAADLGLSNPPVPLGTGGATLTASVNADRYNYWSGSADAVLATNTTSATRGQMITVGHEGTGGTLTLGASAPTGYKNTLGVGETGQIVFNGTGWQSTIPAGGSSVALATVTGSTSVGSTLTCSPSAGWSGTFQWTRNGSNISGATASTYLLDPADSGAVVGCKFTPTLYTTNTITASLAPPGAPTALTLGTPGSTSQPISLTAPSTGGAVADYEWQYSLDNATWSTFADGTSTTPSTTITGLTGGTLYYYRARATNAAGNSAYTSVVSGSTAAGSLTSADITMPATVNLTTGGYIDYIKRRGGLSGEGIQKTGFPFIVFAEGTGGGDVGHTNSTSWTCTPAFPAVTTTDGIGMGSLSSQNVTGETAAEGLYNNGGTPFNTYTIPCGTTPRVVEIVWGSAKNAGFSIPGTVGFTATLSDGSAAPITRTAVAPTVDLNANTYCTRLTFNAASAGQHLTISPSIAGFAIFDYVALIS